MSHRRIGSREATLACNIRVAFGVVAGVLSASGAAHAGSAGADSAEALFRDGKRLLDRRDFDGACPKLAESHRLEAATGTLLALAMCHEGQGKTATAWAEYREAAARSRAEGRLEREQAAAQWAAELEPRLSTLAIVVPQSSATARGISVRRDGAEVPRGAWAEPTALDPGTHTVSVTAEGKKPWSRTIVLGRLADRRVLTVMLDDAVRRDQSAEHETTRLGTAQKVGLAAAAIGVIGLGFGTFFGIRAIHKDDQAESGCDGNACDPEAKQLRLSARESGNMATVSFVTGGVLLAGGVTLYFLGNEIAPRARVRATPLVGERELGVSVSGRF